MNNNQITYRTLELLQAGLIIEAIRETNGWFNPDRSNSIFLLHDKIRNLLFNRAFQKLPAKYRIKLISKLNHKTHFTEGVSKSHAIEYYYLCLDAYEKDGLIKGLEGNYVRMTSEMKAYYHAIDETVVEIADNKTLLKDLIYEVAKPLNNLFYERLELISKELSLNYEVKDEVYVAAPIPYKEYKFGTHTTVKCFEPDIAFGMTVIGVGDSLKPIDEYISDIRKFIDVAKRLVEDEEKPTMIKLRITGVKWTNEPTLTKDLPNVVEIEVDEDSFESAKTEGNLSDFLKYEIAEDFVFTPLKLGKYKIL